MESSQSELSIDKYWQIIKRRWLPGTVVLLSVLVLGIFATLMKKDIYQVQAKLRFKKNNASSSLTELTKAIGNLSPVDSKGNPINTEAEVIRSVPIIQKTIDELGLKNAKGKKLAVNSFRQKLRVTAIISTDILQISYQDSDPKKATKIVNTLIANYLDNNERVNKAEAVAAREFLEEQLPQAEATLEKTEAEISQILQENQIISPPEEAQYLIATLRNIKEQITETRGEIIYTNSQAKYLRNKLGLNSEQAMAVVAIAQAPEIRELVSQLQELESELAQESTRFIVTSPNIVNLKNKINVLQKLLEKQTKSVGGLNVEKFYGNNKFGSLEQQLTTELIRLEASNIGLNKKIEHLSQIEQEQSKKARELPRLEQQLRKLERKLAAAKSNYELLLQQLQAIQLAANQNIGNVRVISYAVVPNRPISNRSVGYLVSGSLATLAAAGVIYFLEVTDKSIRTIEEAKQIFGYTWLGVIPALKKLKLDNLAESKSDPTVPTLVVRQHPSSPVSESYRMLQSNLKFLSCDKQVKTIVITSSVPQEGKSTVVANLASAMAQVGHKVLLIDGDMHHPMQHLIWDIYNEGGLSNVIAEKLDPRMAITEVMPNLDLLTSGVVPPSPATLLDSQRMRILMDYWSEIYDFVIIDTPSLDLAADAPILGRMADGVLLVVKPGAVERGKAKFTKEILEQSGQNMLGIVFNSVSPQVEPRTYYYHSLEEKPETAEPMKLLDSSKEELWETISRLARESKKNKLDSKLDSGQIYDAPIDKLEAMVVHLQQDLADLTRLVKEQEEELLIQRHKVKKLRRKINIANQGERYTLELTLEQEQERKQMLDETLVGQRRNLEKRKQALYKYQQILENRQNISFLKHKGFLTG